MAFQDFLLYCVIIVLYYVNLPSAVAGQQQFTYFLHAELFYCHFELFILFTCSHSNPTCNALSIL